MERIEKQSFDSYNESDVLIGVIERYYKPGTIRSECWRIRFMEKFAAGKIRARRYRNPKIGEFFKEIDLSEKKSTGITKILQELQRNGSPLPEFETDADRTYLITTIRQREGFEVENKNFGQKNDRSLTEVLTEVLLQKNYNKVLPIIEYLEKNGEITPQTAEMMIGKSKSTVYRYLSMLVKTGYVEVTGSTNNAVYKVLI